MGGELVTKAVFRTRNIDASTLLAMLVPSVVYTTKGYPLFYRVDSIHTLQEQ